MDDAVVHQDIVQWDKWVGRKVEEIAKIPAKPTEVAYVPADRRLVPYAMDLLRGFAMLPVATFKRSWFFDNSVAPCLKIVAGLAALTLYTGCGIEPAGPVSKDKRTVEIEETIGASDATIKLPNDASASPSTDLPANFEELQSHPNFKSLLAKEAEAACHIEDTLFNRRSGGCFDEYSLATSYSCSRQGILSAFQDTGFQIGAALDDALGRSTNPTDRGAGFIIDQCGEADDGRLLVTLVGPTMSDAKAELRVRELEAHGNK